MDCRRTMWTREGFTTFLWRRDRCKHCNLSESWRSVADFSTLYQEISVNQWPTARYLDGSHTVGVASLWNGKSKGKPNVLPSCNISVLLTCSRYGSADKHSKRREPYDFTETFPSRMSTPGYPPTSTSTRRARNWRKRWHSCHVDISTENTPHSSQIKIQATHLH